MELVKTFYKPVLCKTAPKPFSNSDWIFEVKWDGFRALAYVNGKFSLQSRNGSEFKFNFPEICELKELTHNVVLDGELIIMKEGFPDFQSMLLRGKATRQRDIERQVRVEPASYIVFDILEKDGKPLTSLPLMERKRILRESVQEGRHVRIADYIEGKGEDYYRIVTAKGLEGVVAEKKDSLYEEGKRSDCWLKIKHLKSVDCVVFGYSTGTGARSSSFGALILGVYDSDGKPVYIGDIGTGFNNEMLSLPMDAFKFLKKDEAPFGVKGFGNVTWSKPALVCEVIYQ